MLGPKDETFFPFLEACFFSIGVHFSLALCEGPPPLMIKMVAMLEPRKPSFCIEIAF